MQTTRVKPSDLPLVQRKKAKRNDDSDDELDQFDSYFDDELE